MPFVSIFPPLRLRAWCNFSPLLVLPRILTPPDRYAHFESFRLFQQMYSVQHYICVFLSLSVVFNLGVSLLVYLTTISLSLLLFSEGGGGGEPGEETLVRYLLHRRQVG